MNITTYFFTFVDKNTRIRVASKAAMVHALLQVRCNLQAIGFHFSRFLVPFYFQCLSGQSDFVLVKETGPPDEYLFGGYFTKLVLSVYE